MRLTCSSGDRSSIPQIALYVLRRMASVRDIVLVEAAVDGLDGLAEGLFEEGEVVLPAVVVGDGAGLPLPGPGADVLDAPVHQSEHVVGGGLVEHPPGLADGQ